MPFHPREEAKPPNARRITDVAIMRFEHIYEVDPALMTDYVHQQRFPNWDTLRIAASRGDHLRWMHEHWAEAVISGEQLLDEIGDPSKGNA